MKSYSRLIIVALDMSDQSLIAWEHAQALGRRLGCALEAVYVHTDEKMVWKDFPRPQATHRAELAATLRGRIGAKEKVTIVHGDPVLAIGRLAKRRRADMIVLAPHHSRMQRWLSGSVSESLIRQAGVPVLVVPTERAPRYRPASRRARSKVSA